MNINATLIGQATWFGLFIWITDFKWTSEMQDAVDAIHQRSGTPCP